MSDIFISYRHGKTDSWPANSLNLTLSEHFAVYFDSSRESNDLGDDFAAGIDEALANARVLFALIGPDWTSDEGMRRLADPKDWVRHELRTALARGEALRIIPLFHGLKTLPDFSTLPEDLRPLGARNGRTLDPHDWEAETGELIDRLQREWLAARRGVARTAIPLPPELPYLCDRRDQEERLIDLVQKSPGPAPIACVVHGHKWEAHDGFLDRLRYQGALEDILGAKEEGIALHPLQLSRERMRDGRYTDALMGPLKVAVLRRRTASEDELRAFFAKLQQPLVAVVQLMAAELGDLGEQPIRRLIDAWRNFLGSAPTGAALSYPVLLWINVAYDDLETELAKGDLVELLPKLPPVEIRDVLEWLALEDVRRIVGARRRELEDLTEQPLYCYAPGKIHMRTFADAVREILAAP